MAEDVERSDSFPGALFTGADFSGVTLRDCNVRGLKIVDAWLEGVRISGELKGVLINDVDVTEFVNAELERRHPERRQLEAMQSPDDFRAMWDTIEVLWSATLERARRLPESALHERVDGEWSFVETMRHLVFATDAWVGRAVLELPDPFHPLGLTQTGYSAADAGALGIDVDARPSFDEVVEVRADRMGTMHRLIGGLAVADLGRSCERPPAPGYGSPHQLWQCVVVVIREEIEHHRYATRDLAVLEAR